MPARRPAEWAVNTAPAAFSILTQLFDKVQGIKNGEKHIPFTEHLVEIRLPDGIAVVGDAHAILLPAAGQLVCFSGFIRKAHCDLQVRIRLIVQSVDTASCFES